jgi:hypothetical protein
VERKTSACSVRNDGGDDGEVATTMGWRWAALDSEVAEVRGGERLKGEAEVLPLRV